jgi:cobalt-precorrin 5A hydrolase/cobalt-precorrin 5A hydrolase/precorrin-3B C17-methyltransferase
VTAGYVVGAGCSLGCPPQELQALVEQVLAGAGVQTREVQAVATIATRAEEPALVALASRLGCALRVHSAAALGAVVVPTPSATVARHVGTPSVAEAAALLSAPGGVLVVGKQRSSHATCALARGLA